MKTSLGIWALGPMVTRSVPGGYKPEFVGAVRRSIYQWRFIDSVAARIDERAVREAQAAKDAVRAYELVYGALGAG